MEKPIFLYENEASQSEMVPTTCFRLRQVVARAGWTVNLEMNGVSVDEGYAKGGKTSTTTAIKLVLF